MNMLTKYIGGFIIMLAIVGGGYYAYTGMHPSVKQEAMANATKAKATPSSNAVPVSNTPESEGMQADTGAEESSGGSSYSGGQSKGSSGYKSSQSTSGGGGTPISSLQGGYSGYATTTGVVVKLSKGKGHFFMTLRDPNSNSTIKGVIFSKSGIATDAVYGKLYHSLRQGTPVTFKGKVTTYKGELEIIVNSVR